MLTCGLDTPLRGTRPPDFENYLGDPHYMPVLRIPTPLRAYTNGQSNINVAGANISEALTDLTTQYPTIKPHLFNEGGELRPFVNLFVGENNIKDLQGVSTPINDDDKLVLIPSIAGG
jgi:molybdopterin converting factor small subunit